MPQSVVDLRETGKSVPEEVAPPSDLSGSTLHPWYESESSISDAAIFRRFLYFVQEEREGILRSGGSIPPSDCSADSYDEESEDEQQRLSEAAEVETMAVTTENQALSPSVRREHSTSSPSQPETGPISLHSSHSSLDSPFSASRIRLRTDERGQKAQSASRSTSPLHISDESDGEGLHHPFAIAMTGSNASRPSLNLPSLSPELTLSNDVVENDKVKPVVAEVKRQVRVVDPFPKKEGPRSPTINLTGKCSFSPISISDTDEPVRPSKRARALSLPQLEEERIKRSCSNQDVYNLPLSPEANQNKEATFSTATTAVNSTASTTLVNSSIASPNLSLLTNYERTVQIIYNGNDRPVTFICHESRLLEISGFVQVYRRRNDRDMLRLCPQNEVPTIKLQSLQVFMHWLYTNRFTEPGERRHSFSILLELYFLACAWSITVLKNVAIDHLIDKISAFSVPSHCTKRIYKYTAVGDQLRKLWVDVYVWEVEQNAFELELESGRLDATFLKDLTLAQMQRLRITQQRFDLGIPPYEMSKSVYHKRNEVTGVCCRRTQYEGEGSQHRGDNKQKQETAKLKHTLEKVQSKLEAYKRQERENTKLKRSLRRAHSKLRKAEVLLMSHMSVDHFKLFKTTNFDNPEIDNPGIMRTE
ncbi:hypothetical protein ACLMJK_004599 [Lecanora helva]